MYVCMCMRGACVCACFHACVRAYVRTYVRTYACMYINIGPSRSRDTEYTLLVDNSASLRDESRPLIIMFKTLLKVSCRLSTVALSLLCSSGACARDSSCRVKSCWSLIMSHVHSTFHNIS